ncbi:GTP-binding protein 10 homolog isoform X2 [Palaemon carinicauda]|uniref:GTP-binding protein 10 homolog isoform X2 n=1 Tax=Palaemon carinicauda TaxID=392227 RepID=UPI0035B66373
METITILGRNVRDFDTAKMKKLGRFMDSLRLTVRGGSGGMGYPKFGGVGGKGGDVYVEAVEGQTLNKTLRAEPEKRWYGSVGGSSRKVRILGETGEDKIIPVPLGTTIKVDKIRTLGEVNQAGDKILVARGGAGGSPVNQFNGQKGQALNITLELKLIADVGLVGFPNAGKSTFLKAISRAKPKIASYPFTTMQPNIGTIEYPDKRRISIADLPGLIEGAWANMGMGHKFLRHVERTNLLLYIVDINGFKLGPQYPHRTALENVILLNKELELYSELLLDKPCVLLVNKMDDDKNEEKLNHFLEGYSNLADICNEFPEEMQPKRLVRFDEVIPCSAKFNPGSVEYIKNRLRKFLDIYDDEKNCHLLAQSAVKAQIEDKLLEKSKRLI